MPITIENDFHHTSVQLRVGTDGHANRRQLARAKRVLCGSAECRCGWNRVIDADGNRLATEYNEDFSVNFVR